MGYETTTYDPESVITRYALYCLEEADFADECTPTIRLRIRNGIKRNDSLVEFSDVARYQPRSLIDL